MNRGPSALKEIRDIRTQLDNVNFYYKIYRFSIISDFEVVSHY